MAPANQPRLNVVKDANELARAAAERLVARIAKNEGRAAVCLSGGSTPRQVYDLLRLSPWKEQIPWRRVHWFIGDERFVPEGDPLNNMTVARHCLIDRYSSTANVHPVKTAAESPTKAAALYEAELKSFYGADKLDPEKPLFDLVLLGIGPDGHTASLFPGDASIEETKRWVVGIANANVAPFVPRVTLTMPALASCREMLFLIAGSEKRAILARLLHGEDLPAARMLSTGETIWLADEAALPEDFGGQR